ncbi:LacI family DNA-binding transcriptional regulator [Salinicoccus kekensis]|uniref:LacI family transcriptional regulator n=1 Tax=Salinicoccus kekensis TaxID=714307 RepID=A0A285U705_9STAP|nr:LacI family DNA-binding transcriptional regulator [Salinicoccus kekensis]SOC37612.1 LacI family transcriptional regulator [Salinicoccus kekensis]
MKKITIKEVAKEAGVSVSTVSQYLNKRFSYMSEPTKLRINSAIEKLDYKPNYLARNLKGGSTKTIGIIVANILHHFSTSITRSIEDICDKNGYHLIICNADDNPEKERKYIQNLMSKQVDGLIIFPTFGNEALYRQLLEQKFPLVFIDRYIEGLEVPCFKLDNIAAIKESYDYLMKYDLDRVYYISTSLEKSITPRIERMRAFKSIQKESELTINHLIIANKVRDLSKEISKEIDLSIERNGVILANDFALAEFLGFASQNEVAIQEKFKLVSIDDIPLAQLYQPPISTVKQPIEIISENAFDCLLQQIKLKQHNYEFINEYPPQLIER